MKNNPWFDKLSDADKAIMANTDDSVPNTPCDP